LNTESDVIILRCFRTGGVTHAGDRQVICRFPSYLIDVHKRKYNMRGKQGKVSTRQTYDSQPTARRLVVRQGGVISYQVNALVGVTSMKA
jgi:hypothetical protein